MIGGIPGNNTFPVLPDSSGETRTRRAVPSAESGRADDNPARRGDNGPGQVFNAESIARRVEALNEAEGVILRPMDQSDLPLRNQQAMATFAAIDATGNDDDGELVGLDLRV